MPTGTDDNDAPIGRKYWAQLQAYHSAIPFSCCCCFLLLGGEHCQALRGPQWVRCDVRSFDFSILGKFGVIMTDPPWEIHQDLPYGTMSDQELLSMGVAKLQDDGVIFMWVTGKHRPTYLPTGRAVGIS
jgi:hypothetical protein